MVAVLRPIYCSVVLSTTTLALMLAGGCAECNLAGVWYSEGQGLRVFMGLDGIRTEASRAEDRQRVLMIRKDGSLDLSNTVLAGIEGFENLRKAGDRVTLGSASQPSPDYLEVESTFITATRSELILRQHCNESGEDIRTVFLAQLVSPGRVLFVLGSYGPGAAAGAETAVLVR